MGIFDTCIDGECAEPFNIELHPTLLVEAERGKVRADEVVKTWTIVLVDQLFLNVTGAILWDSLGARDRVELR